MAVTIAHLTEKGSHFSATQGSEPVVVTNENENADSPCGGFTRFKREKIAGERPSLGANEHCLPSTAGFPHHVHGAFVQNMSHSTWPGAKIGQNPDDFVVGGPPLCLKRPPNDVGPPKKPCTSPSKS